MVGVGPLRPVILMAALALPVAASAAVEVFAIGGALRPWEAWGTLDALDTQADPGWLQPRRTSAAVNILNELYAKGQLYAGQDPPRGSGYRAGQDGRIWSLNIPVTENQTLFRLADGLDDTLAFDYFDRLASNAGVSIVVDLGIPFPVDEVSFYPLDFASHVDLFVRGYELYGNDGRPQSVDPRGDPAFRLLHAEAANADVVVRDRGFAPQHLRYIRLRITSPQAFELDQLEIRGEGFVRQAAYTTQIIDLGDLANLGRLLWRSEEDVGSALQVRSRVGRDRTTLIYHQIDELGQEVPLAMATDEESRQVYEALPTAAQGSIREDTENWTLWSAPYDSSGQPVMATGPGRFIQLRLSLETRVTEGRARVDSLAFELSRPTMARRVVGRIWPREEVDLGGVETFSYTVAPIVASQDIGYDTVELDTPSSTTLRQVVVRGREVPEEDYEVRAERDRLRVRLLDPADRVATDGDSMTLTFDTRVLVYGTVFGGRVSASWREDLLPQAIEEAELGDLGVLGSERSLGRVLGPVRAEPPVFTPNDDGVNDTVTMRFQVAQVIGAAPLRVEIHNLSGRFVAALLHGEVESGSFDVPWDGTDSRGQLVPPGIYLVRLTLDGDFDDFVRSGVVAVAY